MGKSVTDLLFEKIDEFVDDMDMFNPSSRCSWVYQESFFDDGEDHKLELYDFCNDGVNQKYNNIYAVIEFVDELGILPEYTIDKCYQVIYGCHIHALFEIDALSA